MQKFVVGCAVVAFCKNLFASLAVYGCGNASRSASQTLRLFACFASDFASFICHGRIVHCSSVSCILYLVISITRIAERGVLPRNIDLQVCAPGGVALPLGGQRVPNPLGTQAASLCSESHPRLLHFVVRQQPDE